MLTDSVKIYSGFSDEENSNKVHICKEIIEMANGYVPGARLPANDWNVLTEHEKSVIFGNLEKDNKNVNIKYNNNISIFKIPNNIYNVFAKLKLGNSDSNSDVRAKIKETSSLILNELDHLLNEYLNKISVVGRTKKEILGLFALPPNLKSIGEQKENNLRYGLHFDNSLGLPLDYIGDRPNRISFNIGTSKRYLYIVNRTIEEIIELAKIDKVRYNCNMDLIRFFFTKFPNYPCLRITINPGEGYIAPTDHVIHDGSTIGTTQADITFVVVGFFDPLKSLKY